MVKKGVFITGGGGFVGANVVRKLIKRNYEVHVLTHSNPLSWRLKEISNQIKIHKGNLNNIVNLKKILHKVKPTYILHLAAYGAYSFQSDLQDCIEVNIQGTKNILEASKKIPYKSFIYCGSSSEYGYKNNAMKEDDFCNPISYYAATKLAATNICKVFSETNNKPIATLRLFSVYGPYEEPSRFIPTIISSLITNKEINVTPGIQRRDFIYIDDVVEGIIKAMNLGNKLKGQIINLGTGKEYSNDEVIKVLFKVTNKKTHVNKGKFPKRTWDTPHWRADIKRASKMLGWKPKKTLERGLIETYKWIDNNKTFNKI